MAQARAARRRMLAGRRRRNGARPATRSRASRVLAQGTGSVVPVAYDKPARNGGATPQQSLACWDATKPHHLPLPRAVGPYTTIRVTKRFSSNARDIIFGTFMVPESGSHSFCGDWTNICAIEDVAGGTAINAASNAFRWTLPFSPSAVGSTGLTAVPSAYTLQVMNPEALQTTSGIVYGAVMNTQADVLDRTETWDSYFDNYIAFQAPRLMSAGKLALRGVKASSYPLSMSQLSEFTQVHVVSDGVITMTTAAGTPAPTGFAPILVNNPGGVNLEYLVTTEWRVRFDLLNPASAGHTHHPIASDAVWNNLVKKAVALGHGFLDIADTVANVGSAAARVAALL